MTELQVDAVIFDMDGVLIDSADVYGPLWARWAEQHGVDLDHVVEVHPGRPPRETIALVAPQLDAAVEADRFDAGLDFDEVPAVVVAMPGARELVAELPEDRWAVATSALRPIALRWLRHVGLPLPRVLVAVGDVAHGKPAPDPYLRAAQLLGVAASRCLVIEDAPAGISAGKAAGATVVAVATTHDVAALHEAHAVIDGLADMTIVTSDSGLRATWTAVAD